MEIHKFIIDLIIERIKSWQVDLGKKIEEDCTLEVDEWMQHISEKYPWPDIIPNISEFDRHNVIKNHWLFAGVQAFFFYENAMRALHLKDLYEHSMCLALACKLAEAYTIKDFSKKAMVVLDDVLESAEDVDRVMLSRVRGGENSQGLDFEERAKRDQLIIQEYKRLSEAVKRKSNNEISNILARKLNPKFRELFPDLEKNYSAKTYLRTLQKEKVL